MPSEAPPGLDADVLERIKRLFGQAAFAAALGVELSGLGKGAPAVGLASRPGAR